MTRRELFQNIIGVLASFQLGLGIGRRLRSPICGQAIGKPLHATLSQHAEQISAWIVGVFEPLVSYPVEAHIEIDYEHGSEKWVGFNVSQEGLSTFSLKSFLTSPFHRDGTPSSGHIEYGGTKFKLAYVIVYSSEKQDAILDKLDQS